MLLVRIPRLSVMSPKKRNERHRRLVPPEDLCGFPIEETLKQDAAHDEDQRDDGAGVDSFTQKERGDDRAQPQHADPQPAAHRSPAFGRQASEQGAQGGYLRSAASPD